MRIISGKKRGFKIKSLEGLDTRPTTDRIKENIFNIISFDIMGSMVLDLFSGSGAIALEFASRGASKVVLVEKNLKAIDVIKYNLEKSNLNDLCEIVNKDAFLFLENIDKKFDIIFLDPPYSKNMINNSLDIIASRSLLTENGIIIAEHDINDMVYERIADIEKYKFKKYGRTGVSFYRRK